MAFTSAFMVGTLRAAEDTSRRVEVEEAMRRANDYFISTFAVGNAAWNRGAYHTGNIRAWEYLGIQGYHENAVTWATANNWFRGPEGAAHADAHCCGQTYIDLYKVNPQPVRIANIKQTLDELVAAPATSVDDWWWIDAFYMAGPTFAKLGSLTSDDAYFAQLNGMYLHMKNTHGLFDPEHGLWYRDATAKARTGTNTPEFWSRGNGWVIAACARVLEELPVTDPRRPEFENMLKTMAAALLPLQGADGFWRSNLKLPNHFSNPETSGTAFFAYAIGYGINHGLLDPIIYTPVLEKAWDGMTGTALHSDGKLGYVQAIGAAPASATYDAQQDYGYGALLLAGCEYLRLLGGPVPVFADAGPPQRLADGDGNFAESATLDAGRSSIRVGSATRYSWWTGPIFLGDGPQLTLDFPHGAHPVTLRLETSGGETFTSATTVTVSPAAPLVSASGSETGNTPANTVDGSLATRWSQNGLGEWIKFELPSVTTLDHIDIAFFKGNERSSLFDLQLSTNGTNWITVFSGRSSGSSLDLETFSFPPQPAKFVHYTGNGTSIAGYYWNSLTEVSIPLPSASDTDANGLSDEWQIYHLDTIGQNQTADPNGDGVTLQEDFIMGGNPIAPPVPILTLSSDESGNHQLLLYARAAFGPGYAGKLRKFRLQTSSTLDPADWQTVPGWESIVGDNLTRAFPVLAPDAHQFYRVAAWLE
jgi:unsaturated rhamnogalacturonyl hydrolase